MPPRLPAADANLGAVPMAALLLHVECLCIFLFQFWASRHQGGGRGWRGRRGNSWGDWRPSVSCTRQRHAWTDTCACFICQCHNHHLFPWLGLVNSLNISKNDCSLMQIEATQSLSVFSVTVQYLILFFLISRENPHHHTPHNNHTSHHHATPHTTTTSPERFSFTVTVCHVLPLEERDGSARGCDMSG